MQGVKEALNKDMKDFLQNSKWDVIVKEQTQELLEYRPEIPLIHIYEKYSIKQKLDVNNKIQLFLFEGAFFTQKMCPQTQTKDQIISNILNIMVDKHQILKIKKYEALKSVYVLFADGNLSKELKDSFLKVQVERLEEVINAGVYSKLMYQGLVFMKVLQQIQQLGEFLEASNKYKLQPSHLKSFMDEEDPTNPSLMKIAGVQQAIVGLKDKEDESLNLASFSAYLATIIINKN